jgi:hypothetical protein
MNASGRRPRLLSIWHFDDGDVYVSDQTLGAADGLDNEYQALVEDWGKIGDVGDPRDPYSSEIRQCTITLWNGGDNPFSDRFLSQDPENVLVDVYQWFYGLAESHKALIDRFVCQDPIGTEEVSRLLRVDLVSLPMRYDGPVGDVIKLADWPNSKEEDLGKYIQLVIGAPGYVRSLCVRTAPKATLLGSILADTTEITANEDLDAEGFAQTGSLQIGNERMTYSSRTGDTFYISQRGALGTIAAEHLNQEEIQQHVTDFTYVLSRGPVSSIGNVKVAGLLAPGSIYTAYPVLNPARVVFSEKPYALDYAKGSAFLEMQFDAVAGDNNALYPHLAYDPASVTSAAQISESTPRLSLNQVTSNPDRGEIVKAYLMVEWFAQSAALQHDRVKVTLNGAVLGYLERPSEEEQLSIDAEVDIDHGHSHTLSGEHSHFLTDPTFGTQESPHGHASTVSEQTRRHASAQLSLPYNQTGAVTINGPASFNSATLHCRTSPNYGCSVLINGSWVLTGSGDSYIGVNVSPGTISLTFKNTQASGFTQMIYEIWIDYVITSVIQPNVTGVSVAKYSSGSNAQDSDKATTDVNDLSTQNREVALNGAEVTSKSVVEAFDITSTVNQDWSWFTSKNVKIEYEGTIDNQTVFILHVFFEIEFRRVERVFSDDVTADVEGLIDDASGTYTGTPNALITRPDHVRKYLLMNRGGLPETNIDTDSFATAGVRYAAEDYTFNGVLPGDLTVREAEKKLSRECRSRWFWDAGQALIKIREFQGDWTYDKTWVQASAPLRLKGMSMERKRVQDIINRVHLYYYRDWTSDETGIEAYLSMSPAQDNESIARHGIRENPEKFRFDLVRDAAMAADLAAFYLEDGAPSSFYTIEAFLPAFDLQKEDHIRLTHAFTNLQKAAMRIAGIERVCGSGKLHRANLLRFVMETWYRLIQVAKQDTVKVSDLLHITLAFNDTIVDGVGVSDLLKFGFNFSDTVSVSEALAIVVTWALTQSDMVTVTDSLAAHMEVMLGDTVQVREFLDSEIGSGFGMGAFGDSQFGSQSAMDHNPEEFVSCVDELAIALSCALADTVTVTDELIFSSGFGSPASWVDDGFGNVPFGR